MPDSPHDAEPPDAAGTPALGQLLQGSSLYLASNLIFKAVGFVMIPFYARNLSTEQYGVLNLLELATTVVAITFGLQSVGQALVRIYHDQDSEAGRRAAISTALLATIVLAGLVVAFGLVAAPSIARAINLGDSASGTQVGLLRLAFAAMFASSIAELAMVYERMRNRMRFFLTYSIVTLMATLSLNIALIGWYHFGVLGFICSKLVVSSLGCTVLLGRTLGEVGLTWHTGIARAAARFAAPLIVSGICYFGIHFSDRLFLSHISRAEVGIYALVYTFAFQLSVLIGDAFSKMWGVSFYTYALGEGWQQRFVQVARWLVLVLGAGSLGIALFGQDVLVLMVPASYDPPALLLPLLVFAYFLREVGDFFNSMLLIGAGSGLVGRIAAGGALLNLALNAVLIPRYGIWGAAWATFATWAAYCAVCWIGAWRAHRVTMPPWPLGVMLAISACCLGARAVVAPAPGAAALAVDCGLFAAFLVVAWTVYLRTGERHDARATAIGAWRKGRRVLAF